MEPYVRMLSPAEVANTAYLQRRGFGLSDPIAYTPTVEQQADDILAVTAQHSRPPVAPLA